MSHIRSHESSVLICSLPSLEVDRNVDRNVRYIYMVVHCTCKSISIGSFGGFAAVEILLRTTVTLVS